MEQSPPIWVNNVMLKCKPFLSTYIFKNYNQKLKQFIEDAYDKY